MAPHGQAPRYPEVAFHTQNQKTSPVASRRQKCFTSASAEYNRFFAENRLKNYRGRDEWKKWKNIQRSFGYVFFGLELILSALIVYTMTSRLNTHEPTLPPAITQPAVPGGKP
jgi:hypothetical protein